MNWHERIAYPGSVPFRSRGLLDALGALVPVPYTGDKYVDLADWLREGESLGLITATEHQDLRAAIGPNL